MYKFWPENALAYVLECLETSRSWHEAMTKINEKFPERSIDGVRTLLRRHNKIATDFIGVKLPAEPTPPAPAAAEAPKPATVREHIQLAKLKTDNERLKSEIQNLRNEVMTSDSLLELIHGMKDVSFDKNPEWLVHPANPSVTGTPLLFLSDIHFDEYVSPSQIEGVNEYNHDIAVARLKHTFQTALDLCMNYMANPKYDGAIVALGGDLLSGNIHEELAETNEAPILESALALVDILAQGIEAFRQAFGKVYVPCVVGNHGRLHKKPRMKNRVRDNFEWMVYQFLAREFRDHPEVTFYIPDSSDANFRVYNTRFLLTHGDQFKGGSGISGLMAPLMLGLHRKQKRQAQVRKEFDVMMMGHWHQYIHMNNLIVNGSVKGYDEYAYQCNFPFEPPQQALFIIHPTLGINYRMPVLCEPKAEK